MKNISQGNLGFSSSHHNDKTYWRWWGVAFQAFSGGQVDNISKSLEFIRVWKKIIKTRKHFYIGSANLSDRGLTKTKEMGVFVKNCIKLAEDAALLFQVYWDLGIQDKVPYK